MTNKKYNIAVIIGRFQPFHNGHINLLNKAASLSDNIIFLIGSANQPATPKNPWDWRQRSGMISQYVQNEARLGALNIRYRPLHDHS